MLKSNVDGSFIGKPELVDVKGVLHNHKGLVLDFSSTHIAIRTYKENPELSQHLKQCHAKVTKRCAIEISNSIYNNNTLSEYYYQKHITTGNCHDDFIKLFMSKLPKEKVIFFCMFFLQTINTKSCCGIVFKALQIKYKVLDLDVTSTQTNIFIVVVSIN